MPFSNRDAIPTVLYFTELVRPRRILDVGVGVGAYGLLVRTMLDIVYERYPRSAWQLRLEGLEIFPDYRNPVWDYAYDRVHIGDARTVEFASDSFDVVLINDVLEHLETAEAIACVARFLRVAPVVIVSTPASHIPQGAWGGNPHETHRCVLSPEQLPNLACVKYTTHTFCAVCCRDPAQARQIRWDSASAPVPRPEFLPYIWYRLRRRWHTFTGVNQRA